MKYHPKTLGYFNWLNHFLDSSPSLQEKEQEGAGKSRSKSAPSKKRVHKILGILHDYSIKKPYLSKKYSKLEDKHIEEYRDESAIRHLIASWVYSDNVYDAANAYNTFKNIGMTKDALHKIQKIIELYKNTCYTYLQLHNIILEYHFGHKYKPVTDTRTQYLYNENIIDKWENYRGIPIYNAPFRCAKNMEKEFRNIIFNIPNDIHNPATHTLFYHSTNWKSAQSILIKIDHRKGEDCLDFGTGPSFYVGLHFEDALDWGSREDERSSHEVATFIFSLPKNIDKVKLKILNGDEWISVIKKSRLCLKHDIESETIKKKNLIQVRELENYDELPEIRDFDFVLGAMAANIYADYKKTKPLTHKPPKKQLASKTNEGDQYLQERMIGCIFYQKFMGTQQRIQTRIPI